MKTKARHVFSALILLASAAPVLTPLWAHHSFRAEFDSKKLMQFTGIVTKVEWTNPHAHFYVDMKDSTGKVTNWNFELGTPLQLRRQGWKRDSLKVGDQITVEGYVAKDGSKMATAARVILADGTSVFGSSPGENSVP
jgi:Family of unknown function (DUF6152)